MRTFKLLTDLVKTNKEQNNTNGLTYMMKFSLKASLFFLVVISFTSCEENMWFRSEKKLGNKIYGDWNRLYPTTSVATIETWSFKEGELTIVTVERVSNNVDNSFPDINDSDGKDTILFDKGLYRVETNIDNAFLKLNSLENNVEFSAKQGLNGSWTIVDIDASILYIAVKNGNAIIQREFEKK